MQETLLHVRAHGHRLSLPSTAVIELVLAVQERRISWDEWIHIRDALDTLLDADDPFVEQSGAARLRHPIEPAAPSDPVPYWRVLRAATSQEALADVVLTTSRDGTNFEVEFSLQRSRASVDNARARWVQLIDDMADILPPQATFDQALRAVDAFVEVAYANPEAARAQVDAYLRVIAQMVHLRSRDSSSAYNPRGRGREGDALDVRLLQVLSLPAILLTADTALISRVRQTDSTQSSLCLTPEDLLRQLQESRRCEAGGAGDV